jgi:enolase
MRAICISLWHKRKLYAKIEDMKIKDILARQILDSRGYPTVEADVWLESGVYGRAAVPSGASTGEHEAHELRDGGPLFHGKSVQKAVDNIHEHIQPALVGVLADDQYKIDSTMQELDGTDNKSNLGANAILAVSLAVAHAAAAERKLPLYRHVNDIAGNPEMNLPMPMINIVNGGKHAAGTSDIQEFMIIPRGAKTFHHAIEMAADVFHELAKVLQDAGYMTSVGDEGGYAPRLSDGNIEAFQHMQAAIDQTRYEFADDIVFGIDAAASEFYADGAYQLLSDGATMSSGELAAWYKYICRQFPIVSIEDGLAEDDWDGWVDLRKTLPSTQLVGDDLLVTNTARLQRAIDMDAANAILIKPNQIGTLTETLDAIRTAKEAGWNTIMSHRSGETEDTTIAHLAVGTGTGQIKTGSMSRSERIAKYNELLRIELVENLKLHNPFAEL